MRTILRAILAAALLLGGGVGDWAPVQASGAPSHESCCCGMPATSPASSGVEDGCPCPKPEGTQTPSRSACAPRATTVAALAARRTSTERKSEPRPEPADWAEAPAVAGTLVSIAPAGGRDPDLGRHLAHLATFRI